MTLLTNLPPAPSVGPREVAAWAAVAEAVRLLGAGRVSEVLRQVEAAQQPQKRGPGHPCGPRILDHEAVALSMARTMKPGMTVTALARELRRQDDGFPRRLLFLVKATAAAETERAAARRAAAQARLARRRMWQWQRARIVAAYEAGAAARA